MARQREHDKIKQRVADECRDAGRRELGVDELALGGQTGPFAELGTLIFGGTMNADTLQVYEVRGKDRVDHYLQPIAGGTALPGLHVARLPQPIRASAALMPGILFKPWRSPDPVPLAWLKRQRRPRDLSWFWLGGDLTWTAAARCLGAEGTVVVVQVAGAAAHLPLGFRAIDDAVSLFARAAAELPGDSVTEFLVPVMDFETPIAAARPDW